MKAAYLNGPGGPEAFIYGDLPDPTPGRGELLVKVHATTVNHVETVWRSGIRPYFKITAPHILGSEVAGQVVGLGEGVTNFAIGDRVIARPKTGSYAELTLTNAADTYPLPGNLSYEDASGFAATGYTAYRLVVRRARLQAGQSVLITAGASGTASTMIQIAKASGFNVIATAGGKRKRDLATSLGADFTIDHYEEDVGARVLEFTDGKGVHAAIDAVASQPLFDAILGSVRAGGRIVLYGNMVAPQITLNLRGLFSKGIEIVGGQGGDPQQTAVEQKVDMEALLRLAAAGHVKMLQDRVLPFAKAGEAHELMDSHQVAGKIILTP